MGEGERRTSYLNAFWVKFGVGADFFLFYSMYIRPELLYGIQFYSPYEKERLDSYSEDDRYKDFSWVIHGITLKLLMGYTFW